MALSCHVNNTFMNQTDTEPSKNITGDATMQWELWVGIGATFLSAIAVSVGSIIQKLAHNVNQRKDIQDRSYQCGGVLCNPLWISGLILMILLQIPLSFAALTLAPQSLVIPLGAGSTIVFNQIFAPLILKERLTKVEIFATVVILIGVIMSTTAAGPGSSADMDACQLIARYIELDFLIPMICLIALICTSIGVIHGFKRGKHPIMLQNLLPALFGFVAGGLGAIMNILLKASGAFTEALIVGRDYGTWKTVHPYYHIVLVVLLASAMISYINLGLERYDAVVFLPLYNCIYIILSTAFGALFFREFENYKVYQLVMLMFGILITVIGISLLSISGARLHRYARHARMTMDYLSPRHIVTRYRKARARSRSKEEGIGEDNDANNNTSSIVTSNNIHGDNSLVDTEIPTIDSIRFPLQHRMNSIYAIEHGDGEQGIGDDDDDNNNNNNNGENDRVIHNSIQHKTIPVDEHGITLRSSSIDEEHGGDGNEIKGALSSSSSGKVVREKGFGDHEHITPMKRSSSMNIHITLPPRTSNLSSPGFQSRRSSMSTMKSGDFTGEGNEYSVTSARSSPKEGAKVKTNDYTSKIV